MRPGSCILFVLYGRQQGIPSTQQFVNVPLYRWEAAETGSDD
jgi:hypothetical protein